MFTNARNPKWSDKARRAIILEVEVNGEWVPFAASPTDPTDYGPMLFNFALKGIFGEIAESDEVLILRGELPVPEGYAVQDGKLIYTVEYEQRSTDELNRRLAELQTPEAVAMAEIDKAYAAERKSKLVALLEVKGQPGWPINVEWPEE